MLMPMDVIINGLKPNNNGTKCKCCLEEVQVEENGLCQYCNDLMKESKIFEEGYIKEE